MKMETEHTLSHTVFTFTKYFLLLLNNDNISGKKTVSENKHKQYN